MIVGVWRGRGDWGYWLVLGAGLFVLSLGPRLEVAGRTLGVRLPYAWVQDWAPVRVVRHPNRFSVPLGLPVAVLAGYGVAWLLNRLKRPAVWLLGLSVLVLVEYLPWPYPTVQPSVSPFYDQLAQEPGDFGVLDLPMGSRTVAKPYMYFATIHGKPLVEGHVSRLPISAYDFVDDVPLLRGLRESNEMDLALGDISRQLSLLADADIADADIADADIRYLILHPELVPAEQLARWQSWLAIAPMYEDAEAIVYRTRPEYGRDFEFVGEAGDGIGVIRAALSTETLAQDGWLEVEVTWGTRRPPAQDWMARLALVSASGSEAQAVDLQPCAGWPSSEWGAGAVARGRGTLRVDPFTEGGTYTVTMGLVDPATGARVGQPLGLGQVEVQAIERVFEPPEMQVPVEVFFGDALRLLGYDVQQEAGELGVTLHWQAVRRMGVAFKFFVHLLDPETDELMAQADVMPRDWTYPTHWWEVGEVVSDGIRLPLSDVPPGTYRVTLGVYDPETGVRLVVTEGADGGEPDDQYLLPERLALP